MAQLAQRIRHWRSAAGIKQSALAAAVGVSPSAVTRWEKGYSSPTAGNLQRIAEACGVSMRIFWGDIPEVD